MLGFSEEETSSIMNNDDNDMSDYNDMEFLRGKKAMDETDETHGQ